MNNYFIILASGQSKRFNSKKPKQFNIYKNKALFKHSLEKAMKSKLFKKIILVVKNKKSIYSLEIERISDDILNNRIEASYPGTKKNEILISSQILDRWLNG